MSLDRSTLQDTRTDVVPAPRSVEPRTGDAAWIDPWLFPRGSRPRSEYWDVPVADQTEERTAARVLEFLARVPAASG